MVRGLGHFLGKPCYSNKEHIHFGLLWAGVSEPVLGKKEWVSLFWTFTKLKILPKTYPGLPGKAVRNGSLTGGALTLQGVAWRPHSAQKSLGGCSQCLHKIHSFLAHLAEQVENMIRCYHWNYYQGNHIPYKIVKDTENLKGWNQLERKCGVRPEKKMALNFDLQLSCIRHTVIMWYKLSEFFSSLEQLLDAYSFTWTHACMLTYIYTCLHIP